MYKSKVTSKGQITIPIRARKELGLKEGDELLFRESQEGYIVEKYVKDSVFHKYVGYLKDKRGKTTDEIVSEMRDN